MIVLRLSRTDGKQKPHDVVSPKCTLYVCIHIYIYRTSFTVRSSHRFLLFRNEFVNFFSLTTRGRLTQDLADIFSRLGPSGRIGDVQTYFNTTLHIIRMLYVIF